MYIDTVADVETVSFAQLEIYLYSKIFILLDKKDFENPQTGASLIRYENIMVYKQTIS
jgi:hypothetical protein